VSRFRIAAVLLAAAVALPAQAAVFNLASDTSFVSWSATQPFTKYGSTTMQWGNGASNGNWEYAVRGPSDGTVLAQGQLDWSNGGNNLAPNVQPFVRYTSTGALSMAFNVVEDGNNANGDPTGAYSTVAQNVQANANTILIRAITTSASNAGNVNLRGIRVTFDTGGSLLLGDLFGDANANYLAVSDNRLRGGFSLSYASGEFDWNSTANNALPSIQVKIGSTPVPEPAAIGLLGLGLAGIAFARRRRVQP
jgi:PEP-CTERM motif